MDLLTVSAVLGALTALFYLFSKWRYQYWARKGVAQLNPQLIFGDYKPLLSGAVSQQEFYHNVYNKAKARSLKYIGIYNFLYPEWNITDLDIIKQVLIKDYEYFDSHGIYHSEKEPLTMNLFLTEGERWKKLRTRLTPTFTTGKMKMMYDTLLEKAQVLNEVCHDYVKNDGEIYIKETLARFTTDVIGSVAFGLECNCLRDPDSKFREVGQKVFRPNLKRIALQLIIPHKILPMLGYRSIAKDVSDYFTDIVTNTINYREKNNIERKDFMQLLLQLKKQGTVNSEDLNQIKEKFSITNQEIVTEAFLFFLAGFETSSSTTTFAAIELAHNQSVQDRLRQEIHQALKENNGQITYDVLMQLPYLDMVIKGIFSLLNRFLHNQHYCIPKRRGLTFLDDPVTQNVGFLPKRDTFEKLDAYNFTKETLRKYPVAAALTRLCTKTYKVPNTDLVIEKGTRLQVSLLGIHKDPEYYPNPEEFNPENFSPENKAKRSELTWMPFGEGPRKCIGLRFGVMQSKMALVTILKDFRILPHESTKLPLEMDIGSPLLTAKGENKLRIECV